MQGARTREKGRKSGCQRVLKGCGLVAGVLFVILVVVFLSVGGWSLLKAPGHRARIRTALMTSREHGRARLEVVDNLPVLHLYGTPGEMGEQYGTLLKDALLALEAYMEAILPAAETSRFLDYARQAEPHLPGPFREELRAVADTSGMAYMKLVAINTVPGLLCTGLAVWGDATENGAFLMGRNAEYFSFGLGDRGSLIVVYHPDGGIPWASLSFLGVLGAFTGINAEGVAFGNMLVLNAKDRTPRWDAPPIQILLRLAAEQCHSTQEMADWLLSQRHAMPMNVMVADADRALVLELDHEDAQARGGSNGVLAVSNYFLSPRLRSGIRTCERRAALLDTAEETRPMAVEDVKTALHRARLESSFRWAGFRPLNIQAAVFEPAAMRMHISANRVPACAGPYTAFDLETLLELE